MTAKDVNFSEHGGKLDLEREDVVQVLTRWMMFPCLLGAPLIGGVLLIRLGFDLNEMLRTPWYAPLMLILVPAFASFGFSVAAGAFERTDGESMGNKMLRWGSRTLVITWPLWATAPLWCGSLGL